MNGQEAGRLMVLAGAALVVLGLAVWGFFALFPGLKPGRLPGDIAIQRDGFSFFFPITTMILLSLILTLLLWLAGFVVRR